VEKKKREKAPYRSAEKEKEKKNRSQKRGERRKGSKLTLLNQKKGEKTEKAQVLFQTGNPPIHTGRGDSHKNREEGGGEKRKDDTPSPLGRLERKGNRERGGGRFFATKAQVGKGGKEGNLTGKMAKGYRVVLDPGKEMHDYQIWRWGGGGGEDRLEEKEEVNHFLGQRKVVPT